MLAELRLLGGVRIDLAGEPLRGRTAQRRRVAVLALLAASSGHALSRERIIGYLWPENDPEAARRLLSEALYVIRKELGDEVIVAVGDEIRLNSSMLACDAVQFGDAVARGDLDAAVSLYTGPFLDGWFIPDAPELERWSERERARFAAEYATALTTLAERCEAAGDTQGAVRRWRALHSTDPFKSRVTLRFARALVADGERAAAIQLLSSHEKLLREELELSPDEELRAFADQLRERVPATAPERRAIGEGALEPAEKREPDDSVTRSSPPNNEGAKESPATMSGAVAGADERLRWWPKRRLAGLAALTLLILATSVGWLLSRAGHDNRAAAQSAVGSPRIAVLYIDDNSADQQLGHIADGLTEELIHQLSGVNAFTVVSRNVVKQFRGKSVPFDSILSVVKAQTIIEGSLQRSRDSLRLTVQITDATSKSSVGSAELEAPISEFFTLERDLAQRVADVLRRRLGARVRLREIALGTRSALARSLVLRARREIDDALELAQHLNLGDIQAASGALGRADTLFAAAQRADRSWLEPLIGRGAVVLELARMRSGKERAQTLESGLPIAEEAIKRDSNSAQALELRGTLRLQLVYSLTTALPSPDSSTVHDAEQDLRRAVELDSSLASAWGALSDALFILGSVAEARLVSRRALEGDTYLTSADALYLRMFFVSFELEDLPAARQWCARGREAFPSDFQFLECSLTILREDRDASPDTGAAWAIVRQLDQLDPPARARAAGHPFSPIFRRMAAAAIAARAGYADVARREITRAHRDVGDNPEMRCDLLFQEAFVLFEQGQRQRAADLLDAYLKARPVTRPLLDRDAFVKRLRASTRGNSPGASRSGT